MTLREMRMEDIPQVLEVRHSVKENRLSDPSSIGVKECEDFLKNLGTGWVIEDEKMVLGFAMLNTLENTVWALFVRPEFEGQGIGKRLHKQMLDWHFSRSEESLVLGTDPDTRAEGFYRKLGWEKTGVFDNGESRFELSK